jgi:hypothetical protein
VGRWCQVCRSCAWELSVLSRESVSVTLRNVGCVGANFRLKPASPCSDKFRLREKDGSNAEGAHRKTVSLLCTKLVGSRGKPTIFPITNGLHADRQFLDSIGHVLCDPASRGTAGHFRSSGVPYFCKPRANLHLQCYFLGCVYSEHKVKR